MSNVNESSRGALINTAVWIPFVISGLATGVKVYIKLDANKCITEDDYTIIGAFVFALGQTITITLGVNNGLGTRISLLNENSLDVVEKALYATHVLYILTIFFSKLVALYFFSGICMSETLLKVLRMSRLVMFIWTGVSMIVVLFACQLPDPWNVFSARCVNRSAFWGVFLAIDIISQIFISVLPVFLLRNVQMTQRWKKLYSRLCFTPNMLTIPVAILRYMCFEELRQSEDYTWDAFRYIITTGVHTPLALILVALSFCKPFLDSIVMIPSVIGESTRQPSIYPGSDFGVTVLGGAGTRNTRRPYRALSGGDHAVNATPSNLNSEGPDSQRGMHILQIVKTTTTSVTSQSKRQQGLRYDAPAG